MTVAGKADTFSSKEQIELGREFDIRNPAHILDAAIDAVSGWPDLGKRWGVAPEHIDRVKAAHRTGLSA